MRSRTALVPFCRVVAVTAALVVGAASAALLVGCSPDPGTVPSSPTTSPRATASPAAAPTPSPTMPAPAPSPTPPPEMSRDDEAGAVAAATYFLTELYEYTVSSQDAGPWSALSHPDCIYCESVADSVNAERESNRVTAPGASHATLVHAESKGPLFYGVSIRVEAEADELWARTGDLLSVGEAFGGEYQVIVVRHGSQWLIRAIDIAENVATP
jgi:hypothetical protein